MVGRWSVAADEAARPGWAARLDLAFARRGERSVLVGRAHHGPLRVQKALHPEGPGVCQVIVVHPPGGVAGGDSLEIDVSAATGAHALLTTPGAGKWYRAGGRAARQALTVRVEPQAVVEWLPQETIVFDGCEASMGTRVELADAALYCGWEILCLGRTAAGETFSRGRLALATRIERAGAPLWVERGQLAGGSSWLAAAPGLAGRPVCATLLLAGRAIDGEWIDACRAIPLADGVLGGVSMLPEVLVARCLAPAAEAARGWLSELWQQLRPRALGRVADPPRIWNT
ncbi:urease accessory protein UreD [Accumulibacter sp.]|uniref:urease accessory protein UreD n=1 Tax=Accumulibacter sp. TaxID=2053492 RepID=UPI0025EACB89|nr:urease accessory protein UreD [Accumulibacter sp.]MCM8596944.1 urease accessory protein UreD [Accumulibacter sp.]MCM8624438.1 urease accessory protein UreD [Accumulibacter sp.]MDS4051093.1 urease accessory protein UreD [Accumulibacter sp.]